MTEAKEVCAKYNSKRTQKSESKTEDKAEKIQRLREPSEEHLVAKPAQKKESNIKNAKKVVDPNMPKRPLSSYLIFTGERRKDLAEEHPGKFFSN